MKDLNKKLFAMTLAVVVAFVAVLGISACGSSGSTGGTFAVSGVEAEVNESFLVVRLDRTTDDTDWTYTLANKNGMQAESDEVTSGKDCSGNTTSGVVGNHAYRFSADEAGEQTITFYYGTDSSKTVTVKVTTGDKGTVKSAEITNGSGETATYGVK